MKSEKQPHSPQPPSSSADLPELKTKPIKAKEGTAEYVIETLDAQEAALRDSLLTLEGRRNELNAQIARRRAQLDVILDTKEKVARKSQSAGSSGGRRS